MNEQEFTDVLQYLQERMRQFGLGELNARIITDIRIDPGRASTQLLRYFDALAAELRLGNDATIRRIIASANEVARTQDGGPVDGLSLALSDADRDLFNRDTVDLGVAPDLERLLEDLQRLRGELADSREDQ